MIPGLASFLCLAACMGGSGLPKDTLTPGQLQAARQMTLDAARDECIGFRYQGRTFWQPIFANLAAIEGGLLDAARVPEPRLAVTYTRTRGDKQEEAFAEYLAGVARGLGIAPTEMFARAVAAEAACSARRFDDIDQGLQRFLAMAPGTMVETPLGQRMRVEEFVEEQLKVLEQRARYIQLARGFYAKTAIFLEPQTTDFGSLVPKPKAISRTSQEAATAVRPPFVATDPGRLTPPAQSAAAAAPVATPASGPLRRTPGPVPTPAIVSVAPLDAEIKRTQSVLQRRISTYSSISGPGCRANSRC